MENNYIYIPDKSQEFRCRVPLKDTRQVFVVDGKGEQMGLSLGKGEILPNMLQVIQVRSAQAAEDLSYSTDYVLGEGASIHLWHEMGNFELVLVTEDGRVLITEGLEGSFDSSSAANPYVYQVIH